ncbi:MAG: nitrate reductase molybdenum cofactor assembly chaperone [Proteobacteria bacterium]|nr:nitrate reductase molybdenum cofactor assembly chaperone [Pseudomonadota bacterium]
MRILRALSALLTYPTDELKAAAPELKAAILSEKLLKPQQSGGLIALVEDLEGGDLFDQQERYLLLFDRIRSLSLHLFEHVHGESRDRGQAMVDLINVYQEGGYMRTSRELPDFLPLFLEFVSTREPQAALEFISQPAHVFYALRERLQKRNSPYAAVFDALIALSNAVPDAEALARLRAEPDPEPDDLAALDADWEEEEVRFGSQADACGGETLRAKVRQGRRPAPGLEAPERPKTIIQHNTSR